MNCKNKCVMIIGCGMMGSSIGAMSALAGNKTILVDVDEKHVKLGLEKSISSINVRRKNGLNTDKEAKKAITLLETQTNIEEAAKKSFIVIEAIVENLSIKQDLFKKLDNILPPDVPICSNTSGLRITDICKKCKNPERAITTHFWLPAHLVPLVEVVKGDKTKIGIVKEVVVELKKWGKSPVVVNKDLPGQLANRILQAIIREAANIVDSGIATAEDVDTAIKMGMALRFPAWGPLEHIDAVGLDLAYSVQKDVLPSLYNEPSPPPIFTRLLKSDKIGYKTKEGFYDWNTKDMESLEKERDACIIGLLKLLR